ncbi:hypothetical protein T492DRAFT_834723 [Pavlovales sp. CCMP2436]|nr:hypothetical protein T492DRAFT_834723 [Pavlovales sp. CCMP2436]
MSETTIKHIYKAMRDMLIKAVNSNQQTRWVAHLPKEMMAAFDGPIYHSDPNDSNMRRTLWKPSKGTIATDGSHMPNSNTSGASAAFRTSDSKIQVYLCTVPGTQNSEPAEWAAVVYALRSTDPIENLTILVDLLSIIKEIEIWRDSSDTIRKTLSPSYPHWFERATRLIEIRQGAVTFKHVSSQTAHATKVQIHIVKTLDEHTSHKRGHSQIQPEAECKLRKVGLSSEDQILNACADMGAKRVASLKAIGAHQLSATRVALSTARTLANTNTGEPVPAKVKNTVYNKV